jgi:hypothetical protein
MKKISLLLLSLFVFSCVQEEIVQENTNTTLTSRSLFLDISENNSPREQTETIEHLKNKLEVYTYCFGRSFRENFTYSSDVVNTAQNNSSMDVNNIINNNINFKSIFLNELNFIIFPYYNENNPISRGGPKHPKIGADADNPNQVNKYSVAAQEIKTSIINNELANIEMYIARPVVQTATTNQQVRIASHPLNNSDFSIGYTFWSNDHPEVDNHYSIISSSFLSNHSNNILIVRPYRDATHSYDYVDVADFTSYCNN